MDNSWHNDSMSRMDSTVNHKLKLNSYGFNMNEKMQRYYNHGKYCLMNSFPRSTTRGRPRTSTSSTHEANCSTSNTRSGTRGKLQYVVINKSCMFVVPGPAEQEPAHLEEHNNVIKTMEIYDVSRKLCTYDITRPAAVIKEQKLRTSGLT
ncbi:hypothetical protein M513_13135 [Trichuris suis]|uniref:Uncharacterized protein n=1 Tax=Trichuris suis TaxID=68888 RepID=A0A085LLY3_9BILA|nr:hypothetical protein M513_13135 [Trichuris suis]